MLSQDLIDPPTTVTGASRRGPKPQPVMAADPPGLARYVITGCIIGAVASLVLIAVGLSAVGLDTVGTAALAAVGAFWGGLGFGGMAGGVAYAIRLETAATTG